MWKYSSKNEYPNIILHDSYIEKVSIVDNNITLQFDESGFWVSADHPNNPYNEILRTDTSEVIFTDCEFDYVSVRIFNRIRLFGKTIMTTAKYITLDKFASLLNDKKWTFEFVDECYAYKSAIFIGYLKTESHYRHIECQIEIRYTDMIYSWNRIYEDRTW